VPLRHSAAFAVALALATVLAYLPLARNDFVAYDDDLYVTDCAPVRAGITAEGVAWAFRSFHGANWFPLTRLSWMLDAELFGVEPRAFHATNLALHVASAVLLFLALARMTGAAGPSAFAAGVFALHPLHVESVAWAAARKDTLSALFFVLGLVAHERLARSRRRAAWRAARAACMVLGLLAKPILVVFPLVLLLLDAWPLAQGGEATAQRGEAERRFGWIGSAARLRAALREQAELFALALAAGVVTLAAQRAGGALQTFAAIPLGERVANALVASVTYLRLAVWPEGLAVFHPHPRGSLPAWQPWAAAALLLALSALALGAWPRRPWLAVGWLWYLVLLAPVVGIVQVGGQAMADRYTYLPLVGIAIAVAFSGTELPRCLPRFRRRFDESQILRKATRQLRPRLRRALPLAAALALAALGFATFRQVAVWRDTETLFAHALRVTERNAVAHVNLGLALLRAGRLGEAEEHARAALAIAPRMAHAHALRAELRVKQGRVSEALLGYETALRLLPGEARWHAEAGRALVELGRVEEGLARLERAIGLDPTRATALGILARALERAGRAEEALVRYREALRLRPDLAELHGYLGGALQARGDLEAARPELERAAELQPEVAAWRERLGALHAERGARLDAAGRAAEAAAAYRDALRLGVREAGLLNNLAWILATSSDLALRDPAAAVALAEEAAAASADPAAGILDTLSVAYAAADRPADARAAALRALAAAERAGDLALAAELRARIGPAR
jgi:tetratricopeptide (TPR) repeat protein